MFISKKVTPKRSFDMNFLFEVKSFINTESLLKQNNKLDTLYNYINFALMKEHVETIFDFNPTKRKIEEYACGMSREKYLDIFGVNSRNNRYSSTYFSMIQVCFFVFLS